MNYESPKFLLDDVLKATTGNLVTGASEKTFYGISTDSRLVKKGNLFIALKGEKFDGHDFVNQALQLGAAGIIVHDAKVSKDLTDKNVTVIKVVDTLIALGDLAHEWRKRFSIAVIGLTGSSGKTTTKEMIAAIIGRKKNILKTDGNLNNLIGLPQTIFRLTTEHELAILEMGTNTRGEIKRLTQIALPDIGLITNIGPAHLAGFGSIDVVREEKGDLFLNMSPSGTIIVNIDDKAVALCAERWTGRKITFSMSPNADVTVKDIKMNGIKGMSFNLIVDENTQKVEMKIVGLHHVNNAMAAAAAAFAVGTDIKTIAEGLAEFRPFSGRMEMVKLRNGSFLLDDSYNANPASVREALMTLKDLKVHHNGFVFLGDMLELGTESEEMHRKIGMLIATIGINTLFLQGNFSRVTAAGAMEGGLSPENIFFLSNENNGINYLKENLKKGDWILVKGSRGMKMDKIVVQICENFGSDNINGHNKTIH
ncbi:MAG: UDP-N-acetylmuramoyl-tripeptide--D-alanyl-D-alanine ligase [Deltaproteobacteria bacterium HGW-Deltaproteobacteria-10]|jgi:UDP-N-acetylmuramoyl-tripeptide--D-alanyl-D-alanine ligase|nr:MAG: UDP-N-acetylmuramoyl-tripeptide--D-alanyl-D-alanine ligase [Deltaproteobacteria bacterium HGW-Deltaproteobacteria-2]PKN65155.1 MAG: UDP-N-acetylmuramoyl-tripeptide--D-alanyl-D-alanine ligase [Deltaproteobacteria bacterium HGW-Deltaproteobacteria-10]